MNCMSAHPIVRDTILYLDHGRDRGYTQFRALGPVHSEGSDPDSDAGFLTDRIRIRMLLNKTYLFSL